MTLDENAIESRSPTSVQQVPSSDALANVPKKFANTPRGKVTKKKQPNYVKISIEMYRARQAELETKLKKLQQKEYQSNNQLVQMEDQKWKEDHRVQKMRCVRSMEENQKLHESIYSSLQYNEMLLKIIFNQRAIIPRQVNIDQLELHRVLPSAQQIRSLVLSTITQRMIDNMLDTYRKVGLANSTKESANDKLNLSEEGDITLQVVRHVHVPDISPSTLLDAIFNYLIGGYEPRRVIPAKITCLESISSDLKYVQFQYSPHGSVKAAETRYVVRRFRKGDKFGVVFTSIFNDSLVPIDSPAVGDKCAWILLESVHPKDLSAKIKSPFMATSFKHVHQFRPYRKWVGKPGEEMDGSMLKWASEAASGFTKGMVNFARESVDNMISEAFS